MPFVEISSLLITCLPNSLCKTKSMIGRLPHTILIRRYDVVQNDYHHTHDDN